MKKIFLLLIGIWQLVTGFTQEIRHLAVDKPHATADLRTIAGAALVNAKWYVQTAHIEDKDFRLPGPASSGGDALALYPTGPVIKTNTLHPQIGADDFDKSWGYIQPSDLETRYGTGLLSFV